MLTYSFDEIGTKSLYEALYQFIRQDILEGKIAQGEKLPSKRSFAKNLGVSVITVENAYEQLMAEGYIYSRPKSGYYAAKVQQLLRPAGFLSGTAQIAGKTDGIGKTEALEKKGVSVKTGTSEKAGSSAGGGAAEEDREGFPESGEQWKNSGETQSAVKWIDLTENRMDPEQFPFAVWARLLREVLSTQRRELITRPPGKGVRELREAIAEYLQEYQGMRVKAEQVVIGAGTEYLYGLLIQLLGRESIYGIENPGYGKLARVYESHQVRIAYLEMDRQGILLSRLREKEVDVVHISPSHHYPSGIVTPIGRRYELLGWANEAENRFIIEDDYDCEFRLAGRPIPSLQSIDTCGKVIYMNTFTKSLTPTIRISYMILPERLLEAFGEKLGFYACTVSNFEQYTLALLIRRRYFEKHINRMRNYYRERRDLLIRGLNQSRLGAQIRIYGADAGLHFLVKVNTDRTDEQLKREALAQGVKLSCLSDYYHDAGVLAEEFNHVILINYSSLEEYQITELVERLCLAWTEN